MKLFIILLLFIGMFMITHGIYEEKFEKLKNDVRIQYKFIPRTYFDEFVFNNELTSKEYKTLFDQEPDTRSAGLPIR